ncbi:MAG: type II toxin-antitoxin system PemK/MazF family toxin [Myxococcaceae bacterium]|nr:type II toxin-antitoxin system PemK/MazF family toxin [Myxococcaceae bacterium]
MARRVRRGEIWLYEFKKPDKRRPVLVLSRNEAIDVLPRVMVAPITSIIRDLPSEYRLGVRHGLKVESVATFDMIQTVDQSGLRQFLGSVSATELRAACQALEVAVGCSDG